MEDALDHDAHCVRCFIELLLPLPRVLHAPRIGDGSHHQARRHVQREGVVIYKFDLFPWNSEKKETMNVEHRHVFLCRDVYEPGMVLIQELDTVDHTNMIDIVIARTDVDFITSTFYVTVMRTFLRDAYTFIFTTQVPEQHKLKIDDRTMLLLTAEEAQDET